MQKSHSSFGIMDEYELAFEDHSLQESNSNTTSFSGQLEYENPFADAEFQEENEIQQFFFEKDESESFEYEDKQEYHQQPFVKDEFEESSFDRYSLDEDEPETISPLEDYGNVEAYEHESPNLLTYEISERSKQVAKEFGISVDVLHSYDWAFHKKWSPKFVALIEWAANAVNLNPGLLAANLIAETFATDYLGGAVGSFVIGTDDFYAKRADLAQKVPAYKSIGWKRTGDLTDVNEQGRKVDSVVFNSGKDALLASAVYLKHGEIVLQDIASSLGKRFDSIPIETRFALTRLAFNAGHGRAGKNLKEYINSNLSVLILKPQKKSGPQRMATIRTAQAINLSETFFKSSVKIPSHETHEADINQEAYYDTTGEVAFESQIAPVNTPGCSVDASKKMPLVLSSICCLI